ncbi:zinc ribbon domain-containing protein [Adlercreutzia agrestimuris]|uniref:zinc ribbon domain-containing protein n=1 Tax=Adlercreutzia agrestimuris TaxID=2941324 RepID=UPI002041079E|nr:zinc ribbon domain-containing protein [Adlercreutzia agrestimuris]
MSAQKFCTSCGAPLDGKQAFCTSCGTPVGSGVKESLSGDASQEPSTTSAVHEPGVVSKQVWDQTAQMPAVMQMPPQAQPMIQAQVPAQAVNPTNPSISSNQKKKGKGPIIALVVVLVLVLVAAVVALFAFGIIPFGESNDAQKAQDTEQVVNDPSANEEDDTDTNSAATDSAEDKEALDAKSKVDPSADEDELEFYSELTSYYDDLSFMNQKIKDAMNDYDDVVFNPSIDKRYECYSDAFDLYEDVYESYEAVMKLDVPAGSINSESYEKICICYYDCVQRISVIVESLELSIDSEDPQHDKDAITAPIEKDNEPDSDKNKYLVEYEELYPGAAPVNPKRN